MVQRISGLASGMDIDSIVAKMVQAQRAPLDKMVQRRQILQWQRESYRDLNTKILDFRNNKLFNTYRMASTYNVSKVSVGGDTSAISAKPNGAVTGTNMTIKVTSLATAATNSSTAAIDPTAFDMDGKLLADQSFKINGKDVALTAGDTMDTIMAKISRSSDVSAFFDTATRKVSLIAKNTGMMDYKNSDGSITKVDSIRLEPAGGFLENVLKLKQFSTGDPGDPVAIPPIPPDPNKDSTNQATKAQVAQVTINGLETTRDSNTFTVNGVEITLLKPSSGSPSTLTMSPDADKLVDTVKSFINDYNEMLKTLNGVVNETRYRDYQPLTDAQKKDMTETQIEQWEKKAKSGLLYNDSILSGAVQDMRNSIISTVNTGSTGPYQTLSSIGITTGTYQENGKLYLDEAKLRKAIAADPDVVKNLFTPKMESADGKKKLGVAEQMYQSLNTVQKSIMDKIGYSSLEDSSSQDDSIIGKQIYDLSKQIKTGEDRMKDLEDRYYKQFTAMETAINNANAQGAYLANAFSK